MEHEILCQNVQVAVGMDRHGFSVVCAVRISGSNSVSNLDSGGKVGAFFNDDDLDVLPFEVIVANVADEQAVGHRVASSNCQIFRVLWFKARDRNYSSVTARQVCYKKSACGVGIIDVI